jgi:M6 family metalloprotease-like protein
MKKSFLFAMAVLSVAVVLAVPAKPTPIEVKQPDGTTITVIAKGDERIHWAETPDGYSLLRNAEGIYEYAIVNESGDMIASGIKAMNGGMKSAPSVKKHLRFSTQQKEAMFAKWQTPSRGTHKGIVKKIKEAKGGTVNFRAPVIMVNFTNRVCTFHKDSIDKILNTRGLTDSPNTGSVADYLSDNSRGTFQFNADVFGPYTLANNVAYYGGNVGGNDKNPEAMIVEAVNLAKADGCDFSQYDNDGDGYVDAVHVVFAGRGEEESNEADGVWSHQWYIRQDMTVDGKKIYTYSCSPERMGTSNKLNAIGIIVHEMGGHAMFDLPDFYDADYTGSGSDEAVTPGVYDVMDMGSWNNDGYTPPMHNPWSRMFIGWLERKLLTESCSVDMLPAMDATKCYIIETKTPN